MLIEPQGTTHYPTFSQLDLHWDKGFMFGQRRIQFNVDAFNLTNASTVLARQTRQDFAHANYVTRILAPRVVQVWREGELLGIGDQGSGIRGVQRI